MEIALQFRNASKHTLSLEALVTYLEVDLDNPDIIVSFRDSTTVDRINEKLSVAELIAGLEKRLKEYIKNQIELNIIA